MTEAIKELTLSQEIILRYMLDVFPEWKSTMLISNGTQLHIQTTRTTLGVLMDRGIVDRILKSTTIGSRGMQWRLKE